MTPVAPPWILIVEDNAALRRVLVRTVRAAGYATLAAGDGAEALDVFADHPAPALVLLDLMMPRMSGWEFASRLRANPAWARVPIVVLSAVAELASARGLSAAAVLSKPWDPAELLAILARYLGTPGTAGEADARPASEES